MISDKIMVNDNVYIDYRDNILIDKDNPVLAFKANRDRYFANGKQDDYAGLPHLGSINSEDSATWNFIRSLRRSQDFSSIETLLKIKIDNPSVLLWTLSFDEDSRDLQYDVGSIIRAIDGKHKGQITEPDIIIETDEYLIVFECKLGEYGKCPSHLWESSKNSNGPAKREKDYFIDDLFFGKVQYDNDAYQLYRMVFFTNKIAEKRKKKGLFISLANKSWWSLKRKNISPSMVWEKFLSQVNQQKVELMNVFWQDLVVQDEDLLKKYLLRHRCLVPTFPESN